MIEYLNMSIEEWKEKYDLLGYIDYCRYCAKEATHKHTSPGSSATQYICERCGVFWVHFATEKNTNKD